MQLTVEVRPMSAADLLVQGRELFVQTHEEIELLSPLAVDADVFLAVEERGALIALGLFAGDELIGYAAGVIGAEVFTDAIACSVLAVFVRVPGHGRRLMNAMVAAAHERGADRVQWHTKRGSALERLLIHRRAREVEIVYEEVQGAARETCPQQQS